MGSMPQISIDTKRTHPVSPFIYGNFMEYLGDCIDGGIYDAGHPQSSVDGIRQDVLALVKELRPPILRFPGGTVIAIYHWEDGVGPLEQRKRKKNLIWGGEIDPAFGTAEFVRYCREIGAEPMLCVNMASGTAEEAGNWVEYCNGTGNTYYANLRRSHGYEEPFDVKYWCIGNESYADLDIGKQSDVHVYVQDAWDFIKFMKLQDPSIRTVIVGSENPAWNQTVLDNLHEVTDYFSVHYYAVSKGRGIYTPFDHIANIRKGLYDIRSLLAQYPQQVDNFPAFYRFPPRSGPIRIAVDEWNIWDFSPEPPLYGLKQTYQWRDALWTASMLNLFLSMPEIGICCLAQMVNILAPILADKTGCYRQTTFFPLRLYREWMLGQAADCRVSCGQITGHDANPLDELDAACVLAQDGRYHIAVVNRATYDVTANMVFDNAAGRIIRAHTLQAPAMDSVCTPAECPVRETVTEHTSQSGSYIFPPASITILEVEV